jgi:hypothetical protein
MTSCKIFFIDLLPSKAEPTSAYFWVLIVMSELRFSGTISVSVLISTTAAAWSPVGKTFFYAGLGDFEKHQAQGLDLLICELSATLFYGSSDHSFCFRFKHFVLSMVAGQRSQTR